MWYIEDSGKPLEGVLHSSPCGSYDRKFCCELDLRKGGSQGKGRVCHTRCWKQDKASLLQRPPSGLPGISEPLGLPSAISGLEGFIQASQPEQES